VVSTKQKRKKSPKRSLLYKVIELSTVDEASLEQTVNEWVGEGWKLDGVQFAMRESSKRPSMAFVFFTREAVLESSPSLQLQRVAEPTPSTPSQMSARARLAQLAGDDA
jgi:hypothetical protein